MDVSAFTLAAERSVAIPPGAAVFVRSGTIAWQTRSSDVLMDANYALLYPCSAEPAVLTANELPAALTFVYNEPRLDLGCVPCLRLIDSQTFLAHYHLTLSAREQDSTERAARITSNIRAGAPKKPVSNSAHSPSYGRSMQLYVNAALAYSFSLSDVARTCALSPFTASRVFHREAGIPLRTYVRRLRLRNALARIGTVRDISQVALALGFFDHAHFTKAFRAEFGIAPSHWRDVVAAAIGKAA